jgi:diguanylate cyclase (GGDEF)-like protein
VPRTGGDEFALVAPGAGREGAARIVAALADALDRAPMPDGVGQVRATFASAVAPTDGSDAAALFRRADQRLLACKHAARAQRAAA